MLGVFLGDFLFFFLFSIDPGRKCLCWSITGALTKSFAITTIANMFSGHDMIPHGFFDTGIYLRI